MYKRQALLCMGVLFVPPRAVTVAMGDVHGFNTRRLPALSVLFVLCLLCVFRVAPYQLLTAVVLDVYKRQAPCSA